MTFIEGKIDEKELDKLIIQGFEIINIYRDAKDASIAEPSKFDINDEFEEGEAWVRMYLDHDIENIIKAWMERKNK